MAPGGPFSKAPVAGLPLPFHHGLSVHHVRQQAATQPFPVSESQSHPGTIPQRGEEPTETSLRASSGTEAGIRPRKRESQRDSPGRAWEGKGTPTTGRQPPKSCSGV